MMRPISVGAVLYGGKVSVIWEIIGRFFESKGVPIEVTFFSTYEELVTRLIEGSIQIAWNSPLAWLDAQHRSGSTCRAIAMRDTDRDRVSHLVGRTGQAPRSVAELRGLVLALGAVDSPQATLIPLGLLRQAALEPGRDVTIRRFDVLVGKHGDHGGGELDAFRCLEQGEAAACAMLDRNWERWTRDGTIDPARFGVFATTPRFDHCVFTVRGDFGIEDERRWLKALFAMSYDEPAHREMMDLEGLKAWLPGRTTGFQALASSVAAEGLFD